MSARSMLLFVRRHIGARTDSALADLVGLSKGEVSKLLTGKRGNDLRMSTMARIAERTGLALGYLVELWAAPEVEPRPLAWRATPAATVAAIRHDYEYKLMQPAQVIRKYASQISGTTARSIMEGITRRGILAQPQGEDHAD